MAEKVATFAINLAGNAGEVAKADVAELEALRAKIEQSQVAIKGMGGALRSLKGASEEVAQAKASLRAQLDAERGAVSQASLALLKQGQTYEQLAVKAKQAEAAQRKLEAKKNADLAKGQAEEIKRLAEASNKMAQGFKAAGGPLGDLTGRLGALKELAGGSGGSMALLAAGVGIVVVGVVALTAAVVGAAEKLGTFILKGADALRSMGLLREAATGSAEQAKNMGTWVDYMSRKVSTSKEKLNELNVSLYRALSGGTSKAGGEAIEDTFQAVAIAAAGAGDAVGDFYADVIKRGKTVGRISLNPYEMQGKGVSFSDVAATLAKDTHVSVAKARAALLEGRVSLGAGAKAIKETLEARFGEVNGKGLLGFDVQMGKLHEHLVGLTKGVVLEPLLKGLNTLLSKFDETTVTGQSLKGLFTVIGNALVKFSVAHIDDLVQALEQTVIWGQKAVLFFEKWGPKVKGATDALLGNKVLMESLKVVGWGIVAVVGAVGIGIGIVVVSLGALVAAAGAPFYLIYKGYQLVAGLDWGRIGSAIASPFKTAWAWIKGIQWGDLGKNLVMGMVDGIMRAASWLTDAIKGLATKIKKVFEEALGMKSPSKVFAEYGKQTAKGYAQGVDREAPTAQASADALAPSSPRARGGASGSASSVVVHFTVTLPESMAHEKAQDVAKAVSGPHVLAALTRAIREGLVTQGIPTQATAAP